MGNDERMLSNDRSADAMLSNDHSVEPMLPGKIYGLDGQELPGILMIELLDGVYVKIRSDVDIWALKQLLLSTERQDLFSKEILASRPTVETLVEAGFRPSESHRCVLDTCCEYGYVDTLEFLLRDVKMDPVGYHNAPLWNACRWGHSMCVALLLSDTRVNPRARDGDCLSVARKYGHLEAEKVLLDHM